MNCGTELEYLQIFFCFFGGFFVFAIAFFARNIYIMMHDQPKDKKKKRNTLNSASEGLIPEGL